VRVCDRRGAASGGNVLARVPLRQRHCSPLDLVVAGEQCVVGGRGEARTRRSSGQRPLLADRTLARCEAAALEGAEVGEHVGLARLALAAPAWTAPTAIQSFPTPASNARNASRSSEMAHVRLPVRRYRRRQRPHSNEKGSRAHRGSGVGDSIAPPLLTGLIPYFDRIVEAFGNGTTSFASVRQSRRRPASPWIRSSPRDQCKARHTRSGSSRGTQPPGPVGVTRIRGSAQPRCSRFSQMPSRNPSTMLAWPKPPSLCPPLLAELSPAQREVHDYDAW